MLENNTVSVRFRHVSQPNALVGMIDNEIHRLCDRHPQVQACKVMVDKRNQRHHRGNQIQAKVVVGLPGKVIVTSKCINGFDESSGALAAVLQAFDAAEDAANAYLHRCEASHRAHHTTHVCPECEDGPDDAPMPFAHAQERGGE